ncbi:hypothetical protein D3C87_2020880 [compost metagenome]
MVFTPAIRVWPSKAGLYFVFAAFVSTAGYILSTVLLFVSAPVVPLEQEYNAKELIRIVANLLFIDKLNCFISYKNINNLFKNYMQSVLS